MEEDFDKSIKTDFLSEATEMLEAVEEAFIAFERNPSDLAVIDSIFRIAHSLKGSGMSCGFQHLAELAHHVEALLVRIRENKLQPSCAIVDVLLKSNDRLKDYVRALSADHDARIEIEDIVARIQATISGHTANEAVHATEPVANTAAGAVSQQPHVAVPAKAALDLTQIGELARKAYINVVKSVGVSGVVNEGARAASIENLQNILQTINNHGAK